MVYISGPMTGLPNFNREAFLAAEKEIKKRGYKTWNPSRAVIFKKRPTWYDYMKRDIGGLLACDSIFMLPGWENSKGAKLEHLIAESLGYKIFYDFDSFVNR